VQEERVRAWLGALDARHLAELTPAEVARALRALSSCYVERRAKLASGGALESAGKRAAFALFYAPIHFLILRHVVRGLPSHRLTQVLDLGCGTGTAGAAWALEAGARRIDGIDRNGWAAAEASWTYRQLGLRGRASPGDLTRARLPELSGAGILAAYAVNELPGASRGPLLATLLQAVARGAHVLIVEPIARRTAGWWDAWAQAFTAAGGRADQWRFAADLPERQRSLAKAAGLDPRELTARSLFISPSENARFTPATRRTPPRHAP
jgi:SAM-dependent methyltransferase